MIPVDTERLIIVNEFNFTIHIFTYFVNSKKEGIENEQVTQLYL